MPDFSLRQLPSASAGFFGLPSPHFTVQYRQHDTRDGPGGQRPCATFRSELQCEGLFLQFTFWPFPSDPVGFILQIFCSIQKTLHAEGGQEDRAPAPHFSLNCSFSVILSRIIASAGFRVLPPRHILPNSDNMTCGMGCRKPKIRVRFKPKLQVLGMFCQILPFASLRGMMSLHVVFNIDNMTCWSSARILSLLWGC